MSFDHKVAIVTGAGTGIGRATTLALLGAGYSVVPAGRRIAPLHAVIVEAGAVAKALALEANVLFHTVMATKMPFVGRG